MSNIIVPDKGIAQVSPPATQEIHVVLDMSSGRMSVQNTFFMPNLLMRAMAQLLTNHATEIEDMMAAQSQQMTAALEKQKIQHGMIDLSKGR